jgi:hypothetical protein
MLLCVCGIIVSNVKGYSQSVIYNWDFNAADSAVHTPSYIVSGGGAATYNYWCAYTDYAVGSSVNLKAGDYAGSSIRFRNPADSATFVMPTTGYKNITFSYAEQRTNSGALTNMVWYSNDGTHFMPTSTVDLVDSSTYTIDSTDHVTDSTTAGAGWELRTFSFSADTLTNNNAHFSVTIVFVGGPDSTSGNNRFDNVTLKGTAISTPPSGISGITTSSETTYVLFPNPVANSLEVTANVTDQKSFIIYNIMGQKVTQGESDGKSFTINTADLVTGMYYINIRENATGNVSTMKFVKQ